MSSSPRAPCLRAAPQELIERCAADPWTLTIAERRALARAGAPAQAQWLPRLQNLVEPPLPTADFPAFLLEVAPFTRLRDAIGDAQVGIDLDTGTADELQRFVDHYRDYLR